MFPPMCECETFDEITSDEKMIGPRDRVSQQF